MTKGAQPGVSAHAPFSIMSGSFPGICLYQGISNQTFNTLNQKLGPCTCPASFLLIHNLFTFKEAFQQTSVLFAESQQNYTSEAVQ